MERIFKSKPDIRKWCNTISQLYDVRDILFFGDFSNPSLRAEITRIREVSSSIIETQNASAFHKKDHTDFIMLDHIYQRAMTYGSDTDVFIIFSGDGHFSSVTSFLVNRCNKIVAVYGVRDCLSTQLRNTASIASEWPLEEYIAAFTAAKTDTAADVRKADTEEKHKNGKSYTKNNSDVSLSTDKQTEAKNVQALEKVKYKSLRLSDIQQKNVKAVKTKNNVSSESEKNAAVSSENNTVKKIRSKKQLATKKSDENKQSESAKRQTVKADVNPKSVADTSSQNRNIKTFDEKKAKTTQTQSAKQIGNKGLDSNRSVQALNSTPEIKSGLKSESKSGNKSFPKNNKFQKTNKPNNAEEINLHASGSVESGDIFLSYYKDIIKNISFYEKNNAGKTQMRYTYGGTADGVAEYYGHDRDMVAVALDRLCDMGYITLGSGFSKNSKVISVNWDKVKAAKLM